jgi:DNA mismatch repair protein MutS2
MQLYPKTIERKLGFDRIKAMLEEACNSELGKKQVANITILDDFAAIDRLLAVTDEMKQQIQSGDAFPELQAFDLAQEFKKSQVQGYYMTAESLFQLKQNLQLTLALAKYFDKHQRDYPIWSSISKQLTIPKTLLDRLAVVFDKKGAIWDAASSALKKIRQDIKAKENKARKELNSILKLAVEKGYTDHESGLTIRDGRLVVPIQAEHKRRIKGLVVDESTTGKTVYLEPMQVFELNNDIRELYFAENREIIAILTALTLQVAAAQEGLLGIDQYLGAVDFTRAKAKLAVNLGCCKPEISNFSSLKLVDAVHPILLISNRKLGIPVIPLNVEINDDQRIIVISGPNAGGKSVAIKTVGLLQLMLQAGMLVPVEESSSMGIFKEIFIDIGDEQSIENDLSTYSSHLENMKYLLTHCSDRTMFLIDEFGTGTEPQFGGAIAESILGQLLDSKARGLVTTHYGNLKKFAEEHSSVVNAAMRFDLNRLVPQYQLELGHPGSSFALEIAAKIGLPEGVIAEAKSKIGRDQISFERLVSQLEQEKQNYDELNRENRHLRHSLEQDRVQYQRQLGELQDQQKKIINDAKLEAQDILAQANQKIEATIRTIQEQKANKAATQKARKDLKQFQQKHKPKKVTVKSPVKVIPGPIRPGDLVRLKDSSAQGEVVNVQGKSAEIMLGSLKSKVKLERLQKIGRVVPSHSPKKVKSNIKLHQKRADFSTQLDVRGFRANEALKAVADFIDQGLLLGMQELRILHGKGDGILREVIRQQLSDDPSIDTIRDEHIERGGAGVTLITLK